MNALFGNLAVDRRFHLGDADFKKIGPRKAVALTVSNLYVKNVGDEIEIGDSTIVTPLSVIANSVIRNALAAANTRLRVSRDWLTVPSDEYAIGCIDTALQVCHAVTGVSIHDLETEFHISDAIRQKEYPELARLAQQIADDYA